MTNSEILNLFSSINCAKLGDGYAPPQANSHFAIA